MAYDYGKAASGALTGAGIGSAIAPGIGTLFGAGVGGVASLFGSKKRKTPDLKRVSLFDPEQQQAYQNYAQGLYGQGPFADMYNFNPEQFNQLFEQSVVRPAQRSFQEDIIPQITGQFRGAGLGQSTYAGEALSKAGRDIQENLDAQRAMGIFQGQESAENRRSSALDRLLNMNTFAYQAPQEEGSTLDQILSSLGPSAGKWLGNYLSKRLGG